MDCPIEKFKANNVILHQLIIMKKGDGPLTLLYNKKQARQKRETFKLGINVFPTTMSCVRGSTCNVGS